MSVDGLNLSANARASAAKAARWRTDDAGRTIYYPFGPMRHGYVVDARREKGLREADQRYSDRSERLRPYAVPLGLALMYPAKVLHDRHPLLALMYIVLSFVLIVLTEWTCRYVSVRSALEGLTIAPSEAGGRQKLYGPIVLLCAAVAAYCVIQYLYAERLATLPPSGGIARFYPSISPPLFFAFLIPFLALGLFIRRKQAADSSGKSIFLLTLVVAIVFEVLAIWILAFYFYNPKPRVAVTNSFLSCGWQLPWSDVAGLGLEAGRRGREDVRVDLNQPIHSTYESTHISCEIGGLNTDYEDVYKAVAAGWQSAKQTH